MTASAEDLIRMANQIADYFDAYGPEEAVSGVQNHLRMFWTPEMLSQLQQIAESDTTELAATVRKALVETRETG